MGKLIEVRLPDTERDREALQDEARRELLDLPDQPGPLDNLAKLAQALKKAQEKGR